MLTILSMYTLQVNGLTNQMGRIWLDKDRAIIDETGIKDWFWKEAITYWAELHNRTAAAVLDIKTQLNY